MINTLITLVIYIIVIGLILWLLQYIVNTLPLFEPFRQVANIVIMVIGVLFLIAVLLSVVGGGGFSLPKLGSISRLIFA